MSAERRMRFAENSPFPPIADYGFLSDRQVQALVAPSGNVEWLCLPRPDSPSVFGAMLDRDAGFFRLGPADLHVPVGRRYVPGTLVLETTWQTRTGWIVVRDTLLVGPWYDDTQRAVEYHRPPGDHEAEHILLRTIRCVNGHVEVLMNCDPVPDYGRGSVAWEYEGEGYNKAVARMEGGDLTLRLTTDLRMGFEGNRAHASSTVREGDERFVALSWSDHEAPTVYQDAADRMWRTQEYWREWMNHGEFPDHPWRSALQRSALTLKGLTYAPTGALMAAATTSLPETPGGERNWDYRYSWIRDSTFALWSLYTLGFDSEADGFFEFVADRCEDGSELQVMYGLGGERDLTEEILPHLSGYEGAYPVRIGNGAFNQKQHDVWGVLLDSVYLHAKSRDRLPERSWNIVTAQVEQAIQHWREPDRGIWEVRGEPKHFTSSKLFCWVAVDRGARLARRRGEEALEQKWRAVAHEIHADICANGVDDRGVFTQYYGTKALDASLLLLPLVRFLPKDDERIKATVLAIADELTVDGLVHRYRVEETDDGLSGEEGTFTICSFWLVSALVEIGELHRARSLCEKLLSFASPLQLYAEEIDAVTGRHLGNFPQAFTHLALINAVVHLIQAELKLQRGFSMAHQVVT
ncbi:MAG TPA: glycoside hydrolase family 15 protein [Actinomycetota bacterium]|nr:glycoside hydrolase family 15 protein [Actinomycetota bacterium]